MSQQRIDNYNQLPLSSGGIYGSYGGNEIRTVSASEIHLGSERITAEDIAKFHKLLSFMDFALGASEELRNLMVAYEAKQRILK
jgi:hypothetical protein